MEDLKASGRKINTRMMRNGKRKEFFTLNKVVNTNVKVKRNKESNKKRLKEIYSNLIDIYLDEEDIELFEKLIKAKGEFLKI